MGREATGAPKSRSSLALACPWLSERPYFLVLAIFCAVHPGMGEENCRSHMQKPAKKFEFCDS